MMPPPTTESPAIQNRPVICVPDARGPMTAAPPVQDTPDKRYLACAPDRATARKAQERYVRMLKWKDADGIWAVDIERIRWWEGTTAHNTFVLFLIRRQPDGVGRQCHP